MDKNELLKQVICEIEKGNQCKDTILVLLNENNIAPSMHVGQTKTFFEKDTHIAEWLLGQRNN